LTFFSFKDVNNYSNNTNNNIPSNSNTNYANKIAHSQSNTSSLLLNGSNQSIDNNFISNDNNHRKSLSNSISANSTTVNNSDLSNMFNNNNNINKHFSSDKINFDNNINNNNNNNNNNIDFQGYQINNRRYSDNISSKYNHSFTTSSSSNDYNTTNINNNNNNNNNFDIFNSNNISNLTTNGNKTHTHKNSIPNIILTYSGGIICLFSIFLLLNRSLIIIIIYCFRLDRREE
jgi:hypothetical protein